MKKAFVAFTVCFLVLLGVAFAFMGSLLVSREDVNVSAEVLSGDLSAAEGLIATQTVHYQDRLYWDLTIPLAHPEDSVADAHAGLLPARYEDSYPGSLRFDLPSFSAFYDNHDYYGGPMPFEVPQEGEDGRPMSPGGALGEPEFAPFAPVFQDLYTRVEPGQRITETVDLSQYLDILPLNAYAPDPHLFPNRTDVPDQWELNAFYTDYFSIPVPEGMPWTFILSLYQDGSVQTMGYSPGETWLGSSPDNDCLWVPYVSDGPDFWFGLCARKDLDLTHARDGIGLYHMSHRSDDLSPLDLDSLENVYPLPEDAQVVSLALDPDGTRLYLTYHTGGAYRCDILDRETYDLLSSFPVPLDRPPRETAGMDLCPGENCLVYLLSDHFCLMTPDSSGSYRHEFTAPYPQLTPYHWYAYFTVAAWNGETFAMAVPEDPSMGSRTAFPVALYQDGAPVCVAMVDSDLNDPGQTTLPNHEYTPIQRDLEGFGLRWEP